MLTVAFPVPARIDVIRRQPPVAVFILWLALALAGLGALGIYSATPGTQGLPPAQWPAESSLQRAPGLSTLVMFVHPKCPCSRASLAELETLLAHSAGRLRANIVFLKPNGMPDSWIHTDLWRTAAKLPATVLTSDANGQEARRFRVSVSGETLVYDESGRLKFHGGITGARGHVGDNEGCSSIEIYANTGDVPIAKTPAFGCPLFSDAQPGKP